MWRAERTCEEGVPDDIKWLFQTEECLHWSLYRMPAWISNWENVITKDCATQDGVTGGGRNFTWACVSTLPAGLKYLV